MQCIYFRPPLNIGAGGEGLLLKEGKPYVCTAAHSYEPKKEEIDEYCTATKFEDCPIFRAYNTAKK